MTASILPVLTTSVLLLPLVSVAHAGEQMEISAAIEEGYATIILVETVETECETFTVTEEASRQSTYRTVMSVTEVFHVSESDAENAEVALVAGESVEVLWSDYDSGPFIDNSQTECGSPGYQILDGAKQRLVVRWRDADWTVDSWYYDDSDDSVDGDGVLPPCGEAEQDAVVDERSGDVDETYDEEHSIEYDDDGALGCSALPAPALAPVLALTGLAGLVRRRER
jgi:uncharacterized protein (TIGR03382 family)